MTGPEPVEVGGIATTEKCNLHCRMCHFHGKGAPAKVRTLDRKLATKFMENIPRGKELWFTGLGEFFMDRNAVSYLKEATELGHRPCVLTNGQLLTPRLIADMLAAGVRTVTISTDAIEKQLYEEIRKGGKFEKILEACRLLKDEKARYPELTVTVANTMQEGTVGREKEFVDFWRGRVDYVSFNAEYYDIFKFRHTFRIPSKRCHCELTLYLLPTGQMTPCCALTVLQHYVDLPWLPNIRDTLPHEAQALFKELYSDPESELGKLCKGCEWWIMADRDEHGGSPYAYCVPCGEKAAGTQEKAIAGLRGGR